MDGFLSRILYKCHLEEVASVGDWLKICPQFDSRVAYPRPSLASMPLLNPGEGMSPSPDELRLCIDPCMEPCERGGGVSLLALCHMSLLTLACWVCGENSSTPERERARIHRFKELK